MERRAAWRCETVGAVMPGLSQSALLSPPDREQAEPYTKLRTGNKCSVGEAVTRANGALCKCLSWLV